jgi:Na+-translocating ferredoxin:NAD+ oxidoreductase RnfD subunit
MHHTGSRYLRKQYVYTVPLTFLGTYTCTSLVLPVLLYMSGVRTHSPYRQGRYLRKQYVYTVPLTFLGTYTCTSLVLATYVAPYVATYVAST